MHVWSLPKKGVDEAHHMTHKRGSRINTTKQRKILQRRDYNCKERPYHCMEREEIGRK
jgi:hypothetical protein